MGEENRERLERVKEYNPGEHRAELARVLAKITRRKLTGRAEVDLSQGSPAVVRTREVVTSK